MHKKLNLSLDVPLEIQFYDLDPMNVVWHGNYFRFFDAARTALFKHLNIDMYTVYLQSNYIFPVTKTSAKYIQSLKYGENYYCTATLVEADYKIVVNFEIRRSPDNALCARGVSEQVTVNSSSGTLEYHVPDEIAKVLEKLS